MYICYVFTNLPYEIQKYIENYIDFTEIVRKYYMQITFQGILSILETKKKQLNIQSSSLSNYCKYQINEVCKNITSKDKYIQNIDTFLLLFSRNKYRDVRRLPKYYYFKELKKVFENMFFLEYNPFERRGY